jgi:hypothetical protein
MEYRVDGIVIETRVRFQHIYKGLTIKQIEAIYNPEIITIWGVIPTHIPDWIV